MNKLRGGFDWLAFLGRVTGIVVLATLWLAESLRRHNRTGVMAAVCIGYVVLPAIAYLQTRRSRRLAGPSANPSTPPK